MMVIANVWPEISHLEETISTLRFVTRLSKLTNIPQKKIHLDQSLLLKKYEREIKDLKMELSMHDILVGRGRIQYEIYPQEQQVEQFKLAMQFLNNEVEDIDVESIRQIKELFFQFRNIYRNSSQSQKEGMTKGIEEKINQNSPGVDAQNANNQKNNKVTVGQEEFKNGFGLGTFNADKNQKLEEDLKQGGPAKTDLPGKENKSEVQESQKQKMERKLAQLNSKDFNEDDIFVNGELNKNALFKAFKENKGQELTAQISKTIEEIKQCKERYSQIKTQCKEDKQKIDSLKEELLNEEVHPSMAESHSLAKNNLRIMKMNYKQSFEDYSVLKKKIKELDQQLTKLKRSVVESFESELLRNFSVNLDYFDTSKKDKEDKSREMNSQEEIFDKSRAKFETLKKAKLMEKKHIPL